MLVSRAFRLGRLKALSFLEELAQTEGKGTTLYLPRGTSEDRVENLLKQVLHVTAIPPGVVKAVATSETGAVFFWNLPRTYLLLPPFPIRDEYIADGYDIGPLRYLLSQDFLIALVLVRLGAYSIGICRGTELIESKTGTGLVHARHKKGGRSQARFARRREKQIEEFLERVCAHVREYIEPHARWLDYLVYGGARSTIMALRKRCSFLSQLDDRILRMVLDIPEPRKAVLEETISTIWSSKVVEWYEEAP